MSGGFIWVAGPEPRTMHLPAFDRLGNQVGALCGVDLAFNRSCNLPLGQHVCRNCRRVEQRLSA